MMEKDKLTNRVDLLERRTGVLSEALESLMKLTKRQLHDAIKRDIFLVKQINKLRKEEKAK